MNQFLERCIKSLYFRRLMPEWLKKWVKSRNPLFAVLYQQKLAEQNNIYSNELKYSFYQGSSHYMLGIIKEFTHFHRHYIAACREMDISYKVLDISGSDWIRVITNSGCDAFLVWPSALTKTWRLMFDERLRVMVKELNKIIFPAYDELWMWESKRRMRDWLMANEVPSPKTWIFYDYQKADIFLQSAPMPIVYKSDFGDSSKGVRIVQSRKEARQMLRKVFTSGVNFHFPNISNTEWGNIVFQEYIEDAVEWRMIRIGESYFGYKKKKIGDYASGSGNAIYDDIDRYLLDFMKSITGRHGFKSMSLDILVKADRDIKVIELQSLFGDPITQRKLLVNGEPGRYVYDDIKRQWRFEKGIFDQNACCNLRVEALIKQLSRPRKDNTV